MRATLRRWARQYAFARHIPPRRGLRRLVLTIRRALPPAHDLRPPPPFAAAPPKPLFAPRTGMIVGDALTFLGRTFPLGAMPEDQLWRMNFHYMEYLEEVDDARCLALMEDWIAGDYRSLRDSHNSYALSLRVVVWMQQMAARGLASAGVAASLAEQIRLLVDNLETDIGGNHLIKNIKALIWAAAFFDGPEASRWRRLGLTLLGEALEEQILPDGVHFERSPSYHAQVFADLLECRHALGAAAPALDEALRLMAQATADLAHPDGLAAQFNDAGLHMAYAPGECLAVYDRGTAPAPVFAYPDAGYFGRREGGDYFVCDCGRIGPDQLPAHAHGDILSFELSVGGERIIVDPGVYEYVEGEKRRLSRAASSHNTLSVDGRDQADFFGAFRVGRRPNVVVRELKCEPDALLVEGTHNGYGWTRHVRRFQHTPRRLLIVDRLSGPERAARVSFLLHPEVTASLQDGALCLTRAGALVRFKASHEIRHENAVWWPDMGHEWPTQRLIIAPPAGVREIVTEWDWS